MLTVIVYYPLSVSLRHSVFVFVAFICSGRALINPSLGVLPAECRSEPIRKTVNHLRGSWIYMNKSQSRVARAFHVAFFHGTDQFLRSRPTTENVYPKTFIDSSCKIINKTK